MCNKSIQWKRLTYSLVLASSAVIYGTGQASEVTKPVVSGMIIDTEDNRVQKIQIRVKSLGTGACSVRIIFASRVSHIGAPPVSWSYWTELEPTVSGGVYSLDFTPECDGDAIGEIKYFE